MAPRVPAQMWMAEIVEPHAATGIRGYDEFEIDIEAILRAQLPEFFAAISAAPLTATRIDALPTRAKGAYMLFLDGFPVYAGKTDSRHGFRARLGRHAESVQGRVNLDPSRVSFKAIRIMVFSAFDVEALLISEMKKADGKALEWNNSGFGSNDPGRNRDGQQPADFDREYPVDIDITLDGLPTGVVDLRTLLQATKSKLPYLVRAQALPEAVFVTNPTARGSLRRILTLIMNALPDGWQCTVLHGRVILYQETKEYEYKLEVMRS